MGIMLASAKEPQCSLLGRYEKANAINDALGSILKKRLRIAKSTNISRNLILNKLHCDVYKFRSKMPSIGFLADLPQFRVGDSESSVRFRQARRNLSLLPVIAFF